jgi:stage V sporulation protein R
MVLIDQHAKKIMEECKVRARDAGLSFDDESLEYVVTNQDLLELSPKNMIPTLYDYWVQDIKVLIGKEKYKLYPHNPYETVINTRPAVSFYNDNNPDWLNVMIFYHVLGHIDFFQNNVFFKHTWSDDFLGKARADKRLIAKLRSEHGLWVDYVIEFARGIDNILGYYSTLSETTRISSGFSPRMNFFFDIFLQNILKIPHNEYLANLDQYNKLVSRNSNLGESLFFSEVKLKYPEFESMLEAWNGEKQDKPADVMEYLVQNSPYLNKSENEWMKSVLQIVRDTSLYFEPQRRDQIFNEGWASFWHERLFLQDERIKGHEVDFARVHALVTSMPKVGLNPYAIGLRLLYHVQNLADKGRISYDYEKTGNIKDRIDYDKGNGDGIDYLLKLREDYCDFTLVNTFLDQDFVNHYKLFTVEKQLNQQRGTWQYFIKSKKAEDYKAMILESLWHPPDIQVNEKSTSDDLLVLTHNEEGKPLVSEYIPNTMLGLEFLWGGPVKLQTTDIWYEVKNNQKELYKRPVEYIMKDRKLTKEKL